MLRKMEYARFHRLDRKNGRWIKLCEMVLEFHHRPMAMTGIEGTISIATGCRRDSPIRRASHLE
jgi:hypothetical protein